MIRTAIRERTPIRSVMNTMFWVALSLLETNKRDKPHALFSRTAWLTALISLTIISGGFVAGLKAGKIYNTFPKMGATWLPPGLVALEPWWRNPFENMTTVQFDHRVLALFTLAVIVYYWMQARRADLPARARRAANALLHTAVLQVVLGVSTLLLSVPIVLAASHQAVALLLFTVALYLAHSLRTAKVS